MGRLIRCSFALAVTGLAFLSGPTTLAPVTADDSREGSTEQSPLPIRVEPITDIWPGSGGASPRIGTVYRGEIYFAAHNRGDGRDIWRFDGKRTAIAIETDRPAFEYGVRVETIFNDRLLYTIPVGASLELWEYDGKNARQVTGAALPADRPLSFGEYRGALYFNGVDLEGGVEPWKYDGKIASLVHDIHAGSQNSSPRFMTVYDDALYFFADDGKHGRELWRCNEATTELVADIDPRIRDDGRPWGSHQFEDGYHGGVVYRDRLVFGASTERAGYEPCAWDGKRVSLLANIHPGPEGSRCGNFCIFNDELYFSATRETSEDGVSYARELWKYDGDKARFVADGGPAGKWKSVGVTGVWKELLILIADDKQHGPEPWCYDGKTVQMIADAWPGPQGSGAVFRTVLGDQGIGEGRFPDRGLELFRLIKVVPKKGKAGETKLPAP